MFKRLVVFFVIFSFILSYYQPACAAIGGVYAQDFNVNELPVPGSMVGESVAFTPLALKGLVINPKKPLEFQFIVDTGKGPQDTASVKDQANQLIKYFLAGLTIPEGDLWVNLSPYEKNRMVPEALGQTDLGRDLLAQDYILKQLTASLIYPERDLGKVFWNRVYTKAQKQFGTTNIPVNTFNKVWILPNQAQVYENVNAAYVTKSTLKVMLDEDYTALQKHTVVHNGTDSIGSQIVRQIIVPEIEKEVNTGKNFAPLRQIYQALILAKWYKETIQNGLLDALYTNKNKVAGVNVADPAVKEEIYERYLKAYKKGAFNYIKEDQTLDGQVVPRKYFSGGTAMAMIVDHRGTPAMVSANGAMTAITISLVAATGSAAMTVGDVKRYFNMSKAIALIAAAVGVGVLSHMVDRKIKESIVPRVSEEQQWQKESYVLMRPFSDGIEFGSMLPSHIARFLLMKKSDKEFAKLIQSLVQIQKTSSLKNNRADALQALGIYDFDGMLSEVIAVSLYDSSDGVVSSAINVLRENAPYDERLVVPLRRIIEDAHRSREIHEQAALFLEMIESHKMKQAIFNDKNVDVDFLATTAEENMKEVKEILSRLSVINKQQTEEIMKGKRRTYNPDQKGLEQKYLDLKDSLEILALHPEMPKGIVQEIYTFILALNSDSLRSMLFREMKLYTYEKVAQVLNSDQKTVLAITSHQKNLLEYLANDTEPEVLLQLPGNRFFPTEARRALLMGPITRLLENKHDEVVAGAMDILREGALDRQRLIIPLRKLVQDPHRSEYVHRQAEIILEQITPAPHASNQLKNGLGSGNLNPAQMSRNFQSVGSLGGKDENRAMMSEGKSDVNIPPFIFLYSQKVFNGNWNVAVSVKIVEYVSVVNAETGKVDHFPARIRVVNRGWVRYPLKAAAQVFYFGINIPRLLRPRDQHLFWYTRSDENGDPIEREDFSIGLPFKINPDSHLSNEKNTWWSIADDERNCRYLKGFFGLYDPLSSSPMMIKTAAIELSRLLQNNNSFQPRDVSKELFSLGLEVKEDSDYHKAAKAVLFNRTSPLTELISVLQQYFVDPVSVGSLVRQYSSKSGLSYALQRINISRHDLSSMLQEARGMPDTFQKRAGPDEFVDTLVDESLGSAGSNAAATLKGFLKGKLNKSDTDHRLDCSPLEAAEKWVLAEHGFPIQMDIKEIIKERPEKSKVSRTMTEGAGNAAMKAEDALKEMAQTFTDHGVSTNPIWILTNEKGHEEVFQHLSQKPLIDNSVHIGVSVMPNLDFMAERKSHFGLIVDVNPRVGIIYKIIQQTILDDEIKKSDNPRSAFINKLISNFDKNRIFSFDTERSESVLKRGLREQLLSPNSWLFTDDRFQHIQRMFMERRIVFIPLDIRDTQGFERISRWLHQFHLMVDTIYTSNIYRMIGEGLEKNYGGGVFDGNSRDLYWESLMSIASARTSLIQVESVGGTQILKVRDLAVTRVGESAAMMTEQGGKASQDGAMLSERVAGGNKKIIRLFKMKERGEKFTMLTVYDQRDMQLVEEGGVDISFVGDSYGMTRLGFPDTTYVTMEHMIEAIEAARGAHRNTLFVGDMPHQSYMTAEDAIRNAKRLIAAGVEVVKLEGGKEVAPIVKALVDAGIPVMGHIGFTPQTKHGHKIEGRTFVEAQALLDDALALEHAGAFAVVLELTDQKVAGWITKRLSIPTIGIGAGPLCDGQVLVIDDLLGRTDFANAEKYLKGKPKMIGTWGKFPEGEIGIVKEYVHKVKDGLFPDEASSFNRYEGPELPDRAMNAHEQNTGGIDLNQINVLRNGKKVNVQFDPAQLSALEQGGSFAGFSFKIESMTRISSPFQLLGINAPAK